MTRMSLLALAARVVLPPRYTSSWKIMTTPFCVNANGMFLYLPTPPFCIVFNTVLMSVLCRGRAARTVQLRVGALAVACYGVTHSSR